MPKTKPVLIAKDGRIDSVILSAKQYGDLQAACRTESLAQRRAEFEQKHSAWLAGRNQRFEAHGLWCDDKPLMLVPFEAAPLDKRLLQR